MYLINILKGFAIGFPIAMLAVGPVSILCIQRAVYHGAFYGIIFGLGVATADAIYGALAIFGMSFIANFIIQKQFYIKLISGLLLILIGAKIIFSKSHIKNSQTIKKPNLLNDYTSAVLLTLSNPFTIGLFGSAISLPWLQLNLKYITLSSSLLLTIGIFLGSITWFSILSFFVGSLRHKFSNKNLKTINVIAGIIIVGLGIITLLSIFFKKLFVLQSF